MTNEDSEHWWLAEDGKGQVGYVPAAYLKIIRDVTRQEEESDTARKEGYGKKTDGTKIGGEMGQDGERRKDVFSGSDRGIREELGDLCGRLHSYEDRLTIEQGRGRSSVFTGSKDRECDSRE